MNERDGELSLSSNSHTGNSLVPSLHKGQKNEVKKSQLQLEESRSSFAKRKEDRERTLMTSPFPSKKTKGFPLVLESKTFPFPSFPM